MLKRSMYSCNKNKNSKFSKKIEKKTSGLVPCINSNREVADSDP